MAQYRLMGLSIIGLLLLSGCNYPVGRYSVLETIGELREAFALFSNTSYTMMCRYGWNHPNGEG